MSSFLLGLLLGVSVGLVTMYVVLLWAASTHEGPPVRRVGS
jgi:hypothetical protein